MQMSCHALDDQGFADGRQLAVCDKRQIVLTTLDYALKLHYT